ncbi:MAG: hypothetical protein ACYCZR_00630 [Burkholderiales bacterium]
MMQLDLARLHGEEVSEFRAARVIAEYMLDDYIEMLDRGMSRSAIIEYLAHAACSSRQTAAVALLRVLKKAKYIPKNIEAPILAKRAEKSSPVEAKAKIQPEVSVGEAPPVTPKSDSSQAPAPIVHPAIHAKADPVVSVAQEMSPAPTDFKISAFVECVEKPAESSEEKKPDKWAHLSTDDVVGRGFLGEEHRWMTPEEIQKAKEDLDRLHRISNEMSDRRKEIEKTKIQQKEATQTQPETQPDKE